MRERERETDPHLTLLLHASHDPLDGHLKVLLRDLFACVACRDQRRLVAHVADVGAWNKELKLAN